MLRVPLKVHVINKHCLIKYSRKCEREAEILYHILINYTILRYRDVYIISDTILPRCPYRLQLFECSTSKKIFLH